MLTLNRSSAAERFVAWLAVHHLREDTSCQEVGLRIAEVEQFGLAQRNLPSDNVRAWAEAWRASLRRQGRGRLRWHAFREFPNAAPLRHDPALFDIQGGLRLLLGAPMRHIALLPLRNCRDERRLIVGPHGDWVTFRQARTLENVLPCGAPVERVWFAEGGTDCPDFDEDEVLDLLANGWRPERQAEIQLAIDAAESARAGDPPPSWPHVPDPTGLSRALPMTKGGRTWLSPEDLGGEPGHYPPLLIEAVTDLLLGSSSRPKTGERRGFLRLLPGMSCYEVAHILDGLVGDGWALGAINCGPVAYPCAVVCCPDAPISSILLEPDWAHREDCARFDRVRGIPVLPESTGLSVRAASGVPAASLLPLLAPRAAVLEAVAGRLGERERNPH